MADYATLKAAIQAVIYENGNQEITGSVMQATLLAMVNSLGANYQYAGIATPSTNPGTPDQNVFYLASTAGTYVNFGNIILESGESAILKYNGTWVKETTGFASLEEVLQLEKLWAADISGISYQEQEGIITPTGAATSSSAWRRYIIPNNGYKKVIAHIYTDTRFMAIAFYNSESWGASSFMAQESITGRNGLNDYSVAIPDGCKTIIVCNRYSSFSTPDIKLLTGGVNDILKDLQPFYSSEYSGIGKKLANLVFLDGYTLGPSTGQISTNSKTIACEQYFKVSDYAIDGMLYFFYNGLSTNQIWKCVAFYTENKSFISRFGFKYVNQVGVPNNAVYFRLALGLATSGGTDIGGHSADYDLPNAYMRESLLSFMDNINIKGDLIYSGDKINLQNTFGMRKIFSLSSSYPSPQGATSFDKYLFVCHDGNATMQIYDIETGQLQQSLSMPNPSENYHCNTVCFGTEKYSESDAFPLLYVAMEAPSVHTIMVYRIVLASNQWSISKVQEIIAPEPSDETIWYPNVAIDRLRNKFYVWGLANYPWSAAKQNTLKYARFAMPAFGENVTLSWEQKEDVFTIAERSTGQGNFFVNGLIYQALGTDVAPEFAVIDPINHLIKSNIDFKSNGISLEPEFVFEYKNELYVGFYNRAIYRLIV